LVPDEPIVALAFIMDLTRPWPWVCDRGASVISVDAEALRGIVQGRAQGG
jgi:hypothetical protein